ncbi:MAG TPA: hydrogenase expression/formation protein [Casimicrobiaceae bacterium]|nr:hydrogenase expression/formation protein [Casimicrobiaceae bacterium]
MKNLQIPIRVLGAGSHPEEDAPQCLEIPRVMNTFRMPFAPERAGPEALSEARETLQEFFEALEPWDPAMAAHGPCIDIGGMSSAALEVIDQMLGEGEVGIRIGGARTVHIQESVFAGIWRVCELDENRRLVADRIEAGSLPRIVVDTARGAAAPLLAPVALLDGAMNSPSLLAEIAEWMRERRPGHPVHVVNLTLFPLTPDDHRALEQALPIGPVAIISRGFGNCRITSTLARDVWRVQYFNTMNTLILNTLEIVEAPEVALAAVEDLVDSRERLGELVEWMGES